MIVKSSNIKFTKGVQKKKQLTLIFLFVQLFLVHEFAYGQTDSLRRLITTTTNDSIRVEAYIHLSRAIQKTGIDSDEPIQLATNALNLSIKLKHAHLNSKALDNLGLLNRFKQNYAESASQHISAYKLAVKNGSDTLHQIICANNAAVASRYNGDYDVSVAYYLAALRLAEKTQNLRSMEVAYNGLGISFMNQPNREKLALSYLEKALKIAIKSNNKRGQAMQLLSISGYYVKTGDYKRARTELDRLLELNKELKDQHGIAMTYQQIGEVYEAEKKVIEAGNYFKRALTVFKEMGNKLQQANTHFKLGQIYYNQNDITNSLIAFEQSEKLANELDNKVLLMNSAKAKAEIYEKLNQPLKALALFKFSQAQRDSLNHLEQALKMESLQKQFDTEHKEYEIALLSNSKKAQAAELKNKNLLVVFLTVVLVGILTIAFFQYRLRKTRADSAVALQNEEKEKLAAIYEKNLMESEMIAARMQITPHFLFNSLNSIKFLIQSNENKKARDYLVLLSRFIRSILETSKSPIYTLDEELNLINGYLQLENNRFDDDFNFTIKNEMDCWKELKIIPPLLLQPFVENAIWHGLLPSDEKIKRLDISVSSNQKCILIDIEDFGVGRSTLISVKNHQSMGYQITNKRIELYNKNSLHKINWVVEDKVDDNGTPTGTKVSFTIDVNSDEATLNEAIPILN